MSWLENPLLIAEERNPDEKSWPFMEKRRTLRVQTLIIGPSMTKTDMAEQCDINVIMSHYKKTGLIAHFAPGGARYEDLPDQSDYHEAMNLVTQAQRSFESLPAELRDKFSNDPARLLRFLEDPKNRQEAEQLGLIDARPSEPVPPPPPPPKEEKKPVS